MDDKQVISCVTGSWMFCVWLKIKNKQIKPDKCTTILKLTCSFKHNITTHACSSELYIITIITCSDPNCVCWNQSVHQGLVWGEIRITSLFYNVSYDVISSVVMETRLCVSGCVACFLPGSGRSGTWCAVVISPLQYCTRPGLPGPGVTTPPPPLQAGERAKAALELRDEVDYTSWANPQFCPPCCYEV